MKFVAKDDNLNESYFMLLKDNGECYYFVRKGKEFKDFQYGKYRRSSTDYVITLYDPSYESLGMYGLDEPFVRLMGDKWIYGGLTFTAANNLSESTEVIEWLTSTGDKIKEKLKSRR